MKTVLVIGAGGIGGLLVDLVARAIAESGFNEQVGCVSLTVMDADVVTARNLPHQRFSRADIGRSKVHALIDSIGPPDGIELIPIAEDFSEETDLSIYNLVVVAVDSERPRDMVHARAEHWLDLRSTGDGFVMFSHKTDERILDNHPRASEGVSASCQLNGAVELGNIQFGFALAATCGAQWVIQWLRGSSTPVERMYTIHGGNLPFKEAQEMDS